MPSGKWKNDAVGGDADGENDQAAVVVSMAAPSLYCRRWLDGTNTKSTVGFFES